LYYDILNKIMFPQFHSCYVHDFLMRLSYRKKTFHILVFILLLSLIINLIIE